MLPIWSFFSILLSLPNYLDFLVPHLKLPLWLIEHSVFLNTIGISFGFFALIRDENKHLAIIGLVLNGVIVLIYIIITIFFSLVKLYNALH